MWAKEWRLLMWPVGVFAMALAWFVMAILLLNYLLEYQSIALTLANLDNQRGATQILLRQGNQIVINMMILWSIYFGARSFALERQWGTDGLYYGSTHAIWRVMFAKIGALFVSLACIAVPFWVFYIGLIRATQWDMGIVVGLLLSQGFILLYAGLLSLLVSVIVKQALSASLILALMWLFLWIAPTLSNDPPALVAIMQWLSPFEHVRILSYGIILQLTIGYTVLHTLIFMTLIPIYWVKDR